MTDDPLALDARRMREMGYAVVDMLVERMTRLAHEPALRTATRDELAALLDEPPPRLGPRVRRSPPTA